MPAELSVEDTVDTWRQWLVRWDATPGDHLLQVRATDRTGTRRRARSTAPPFPDGATGYHTVVGAGGMRAAPTGERRVVSTPMRQDGWMGMTRVLVVDDEPMVREVLQRYLELEGYEVAVAEDGEAALASFIENRSPIWSCST